MCQRDLDKFTVSNSNGNGDSAYPVGLLTADEVRMTGASLSTNTSYYLYTNQDYLLLSPYSSGSSNVHFYTVHSDGVLDHDYDIYTNPLGVRPVVSLKPNVRLDGGDGTANNPYTVSLPS